MPSKAELKADIALLEDQHKKINAKIMLAEHESIRKGWERHGLALRHAIDLMCQTLAQMESAR